MDRSIASTLEIVMVPVMIIVVAIVVVVVDIVVPRFYHGIALFEVGG